MMFSALKPTSPSNRWLRTKPQPLVGTYLEMAPWRRSCRRANGLATGPPCAGALPSTPSSPFFFSPPLGDGTPTAAAASAAGSPPAADAAATAAAAGVPASAGAGTPAGAAIGAICPAVVVCGAICPALIVGTGAAAGACAGVAVVSPACCRSPAAAISILKGTSSGSSGGPVATVQRRKVAKPRSGGRPRSPKSQKKSGEVQPRRGVPRRG
mmetsp:Transcript_9401/g.23425  ORF Transcript_9401/g.23425 Transcript_9401/m.23425 type:complete len:212 (+) Transcript_9401:2116-2751(+)